MSISFDSSENNKKETLARIKKTITECFSEIEYKPYINYVDNYCFFSNPDNTVFDYLALLMKIKKSFSFAINDKYIAGKSEISSISEGVAKAQDDVEIEKEMGRREREGFIIISNRPRVHLKGFRIARFVNLTVESRDFHFIAEAKRLLDKDKVVVLVPKTTEDIACIIYLAIQSNVPIVPYCNGAVASVPVDVRACYDSSFNEKVNLKNIAENLKRYLK